MNVAYVFGFYCSKHIEAVNSQVCNVILCKDFELHYYLTLLYEYFLSCQIVLNTRHG